MKLYQCNICGNMVEMISDSGVVPSCCSQEMELLKPGTNEDASIEKHIPVFIRDGEKVTVSVGGQLHPFTKEHYIEWIVLISDKGIYRRCLKDSEPPMTVFMISSEEKIIDIQAYCNIHGLWSIRK